MEFVRAEETLTRGKKLQQSAGTRLGRSNRTQQRINKNISNLQQQLENNEIQVLKFLDGVSLNLFDL